MERKIIKQLFRKNKMHTIRRLNILMIPLLFITTFCHADNFYIDNNDPNPGMHKYEFNTPSGVYKVTVNKVCRGNPGGYVHVSVGPGRAELDLPATDNPQVFGQHVPIIITASPSHNPAGIACGVVEAGSSDTFPP